jgi:glycosyltransferase involved in cell wall biosynthesis
MPNISIIVPVYNAEKYLHRCVNSILNQTFIDWECILIDDGSTDESGKICDEYSNKDTRFHVIHKKNGGVSSARQLGIETAIGDYVIHVDPDDWIEPDMLEELYKKIVEDDADMVICDFIWNRPSGISLSSQKPSAFDSKSIMIDLLTERLHGSCWNKLVRRDIIVTNHITFPPQLSIHEDMFFFTELLLNNIKVTYLNKAFYHYVIGENANSISQTIGQSYEYDVMILNMFDKLLDGNECKKYAHRLFATKVIEKEFCRNECTSIGFIKKCIPFINYIAYIKSRKLRIACILSMVGFYSLIKNIE